jgi:hypothetical protein
MILSDMNNKSINTESTKSEELSGNDILRDVSGKTAGQVTLLKLLK